MSIYVILGDFTNIFMFLLRHVNALPVSEDFVRVIRKAVYETHKKFLIILMLRY